MKIGIFSDIHDHPERIGDTVRYFKDEKVDLIIGAGDISNHQQGIAQVLSALSQAKIPSIVFPGSHEKILDWQAAWRYASDTVHDGLRQRKFALPDFDLITVPGSELVSGGEFLLKADGTSRPEDGHYVVSVNDLDTLVDHPQKTIITCHNPPKFGYLHAVDHAFFGEYKSKHGSSVLPGYDALFYNQVLEQIGERIPTKRENRGYQPFSDKIAQKFPAGNEKVISGHFHESTHRAHTREGAAVAPGVWSKNLYHMASCLDLDRIAIWETRLNGSYLEVKYKNVNLADLL